MQYTKFQVHRRIGSEEGDFLKIFTIYGPGSHLGHVTGTYDYDLIFIPIAHGG